MKQHTLHAPRAANRSRSLGSCSIDRSELVIHMMALARELKISVIMSSVERSEYQYSST